MINGLQSDALGDHIRSGEAIVNAMTIDVEDYFHVEAFSEIIPSSRWSDLPQRVEQNTERVMAILSEAGVKATFFTLGWVAERYKALIRRIVADGHELASHGCSHIRADKQMPEEFRTDVRCSKRILEDIGGVAVAGYRAATFSVGSKNLWVYDILAEEGFSYSSSIYPIRHDLYGMPDGPRAPFARPSGLVEIPLTTLRFVGRNLPVSGGGYFRLLPYPVSRWSIRRINSREQIPCVFYMHPWEIDPGQPRQLQAPLRARLRHYLNLRLMEGRLRRLLNEFAWGRVDAVFLSGRRRYPEIAL
jgi:polysaccharide deacetylase family protein (PEP-CTERM system associated)